MYTLFRCLLLAAALGSTSAQAQEGGVDVASPFQAEVSTQGTLTTDVLTTALGMPNLSYEHFFGAFGLRAGVGAGALLYFVSAQQVEVGASYGVGDDGLYVFASGVVNRLEYEGTEAVGRVLTGGLGFRKRFGRFYLDGYAGLSGRTGDEAELVRIDGSVERTVSAENGLSLARGLRLGVAF